MHPFDITQLAAALVLLHRAHRHREGGHTQAEEDDSEARSLLHAILDRHGIELDVAEQLRQERTERNRSRLITELESGFGTLP